MFRRIGVMDDASNATPSLQDCIETVLQQADSLIEDVLEGLLVAADSVKGKSTYGNQIRISKTVVELLDFQADALKATFAAELRQAVYNTGAVDFSEPAQVHFEDLQLFDSKQLDASISMALAQQEVFRCVEDVRPALDALISTLLGWITVQPHLNPLRPEVFVHALRQSLMKYVPDEMACAALMSPAAGLMGVGMHQLYRDACQWLRSQGVEPAAPVGTQVGSTQQGGKSAQTSIGRTIITLDKLRRMLTGEFDLSMIGVGTQDFLHTVPASFVAMEDLKLVEPMMKRLAQRAASHATEDQSGAKAPAVAVVRDPAQSKQMGKQLGEEVVFMMVEQLMQDERLLPKVRNLIKSLEPVLLALALSDPRFFSDRNHPARRFLDQITHRSLAFNAENDIAFLRFFKSVSIAVELLIQGDPDAASFAQNLHVLEELWSKDEAAQRQQHEEAARALLHAEQRNLLAQRLADDFQERQKGKNIPDWVAAFLRGPWAQVVAQSQLDCVDGRNDANAYLALVDELIWSVQERLTRRNPVRLVKLVPDLLIKLRQGLQLIGYPQERIPALFDALVSIHEKAFEAGHKKGVEQPAAQLPEAPSPAVGREDAVEKPDQWPEEEFWVSQQEAQESGYLMEENRPLVEMAQRPWSAGDLKPGMWVELLVKGNWLRAQLTWASPQGTLFMFVSGGGLAHAMSRRTMDSLRMRGSIRVISEGHVLDHALDAVAQTVMQNEMGRAAPP